MLRLVVVALMMAAPVATAADDFNRDVRPILADACFHCHGPDAAHREAGLRLDAGELSSKRAAELVRRITSTDPDEIMPPPDSNRVLSAAQREQLKTWAESGAKLAPHWAFVPLPDSVPVPSATAWARNPVDAFVEARLGAEKLSPAAAAAPEAWFRRVNLDLTGLPPQPGDVQRFRFEVHHRGAEAAFERAVDRLLARPSFGERLAADWLDLARFADTHGYQFDRPRPVWPYRDWVIAAFNRNLPFDQFLTDQLAGDLRPNPTRDQRLATAFNRLHMQTEEGGVVAEEFRVAYVADRVATVGTAALGLTLECARCHDHKFDPITQRDYYSVFALFQNIDEAGQIPYFTRATPTPALALSTPDQDAELARLTGAVRAAEQALARARAAVTSPPPPRAPAGLTPLALNAESAATVTLEAGQTKTENAPGLPAGPAGRGVLLDGESGLRFPGQLEVTAADPFTIAVRLHPTKSLPSAVVLHKTKAPVDAGNRGLELTLESNRPAFTLGHLWPGNAVKVVARSPLPLAEWSHVAVTVEGSSTAAGVNVFVNGQPVPVDVVRDRLTRDITYGSDEPPLTLGNRFRDAGFQGGVTDLAVAKRALTAVEIAAAAGTPPPPTDPAWQAAHIEAVPAVIEARTQLAEARRERLKLLNAVPEIMVMDELPTPKPAFVLMRGAYDAPGEAVTAGTPAALPPLGDRPANRLGFAQWLTDPAHPLTARVAVNRFWQQFFGTGLVETSDNFGTTGPPPTHPELLDWLARDFINQGWDTKRFVKQLVLSSTYRQSTHTPAELRQRDPYNRLLARMPARRLTAEMLRDQALALSGLLTTQLGGPSVYPYQPAGLWDEAMGRPNYPQSTGPDLYRRSLYTVAKRTAPHPQMSTFDAPDRSLCTARRQETTTPLQALALLNDPQVIEAARHLGIRMHRDGGDTLAAQTAWLFRLCTGRTATDAETAALVKLHAEALTHYTNDPAAAAELLAVGESKPPPDAPAQQAAALTVALAVLNHADAVRR